VSMDISNSNIDPPMVVVELDSSYANTFENLITYMGWRK